MQILWSVDAVSIFSASFFALSFFSGSQSVGALLFNVFFLLPLQRYAASSYMQQSFRCKYCGLSTLSGSYERVLLLVSFDSGGQLGGTLLCLLLLPLQRYAASSYMQQSFRCKYCGLSTLCGSYERVLLLVSFDSGGQLGGTLLVLGVVGLFVNDPTLVTTFFLVSFFRRISGLLPRRSASAWLLRRSDHAIVHSSRFSLQAA